MATPKHSLTFPHEKLTPIVGTPSYLTVKLLIKEVYANARAIPSTRGGGNHGHLGFIMPAADYQTLAGHAFTLPAHPGDTPANVNANSTQYQLAEGIRAYNATITELTIAISVQEEIKKQILAAVERVYLARLDNDTFGFAPVTVTAMLTHLDTTYGIVTHADLERNRASLTTLWTLHDPIESLWERHREVQRIATAGGDPISDQVLLENTIKLFESTGVFSLACEMWRMKAAANKTYTDFITYFTAENKERIRKLTTGSTGYHGANVATTVNNTNTMTTATSHTTAATQGPVTSNDGVSVYYCWTHGLGFNKNHTSATCSNPGTGHCQTATIKNMHGGNNTIMTNRRKPKPGTDKSADKKPTETKKE